MLWNPKKSKTFSFLKQSNLYIQTPTSCQQWGTKTQTVSQRWDKKHSSYEVSRGEIIILHLSTSSSGSYLRGSTASGGINLHYCPLEIQTERVMLWSPCSSSSGTARARSSPQARSSITVTDTHARARVRHLPRPVAVLKWMRPLSLAIKTIVGVKNSDIFPPQGQVSLI